MVEQIYILTSDNKKINIEEEIMLSPRILTFWLTATIISLLLIDTALAQPARINDENREKTLVIGKVGDNPKKVYPRLKPLSDYLASKLVDQGIEQAEVLIAPDNETMVSWLKQGKIDLVTETPFSAVYLQERAKLKAIARSSRNGVSSYHTVFFVHKDSGIQSLDDLMGKVIAFEDIGSTSAYFLPSAELISKGFKMSYMSTIHDFVSTESINYVFSGEEINSTAWVQKKLVAVAALSNLDWESEEAVPKSMRAELRIIHRTRDYPRSIELVNLLRPKIFINRLTDELFRAHMSPEGVAAMKKLKKTTRFDEIDEKTHQTLQATKELLNMVRDTLE